MSGELIPVAGTIIRREPDNLPMMLKTIDGFDGRPPRVFTLVPGGYLAFFTGVLVEASRVHAIGKADIDRLAAILQITATDLFEFEITDVIAGYACLIAFGFQSPKVLRDLFAALTKNPGETIAQYSGNPFVLLVIANLQDEAEATRTGPFDDVERRFRIAARRRRDDMRKVIPLGRGNASPPSLFFEHISRMARRLGSDLKLPARDPSRGGAASTPFLEFALTMRRLLLEQVRSFGANPTRFGRMEQMTEAGVVAALEHARAIVGRKPV
jgi:hypothetical protein